MTSLGLSLALALIVLGIAIATDPFLRLWLKTPRHIRIRVEKLMDLHVGSTYLVMFVALNALGKPVPFTVAPTSSVSDPVMATLTLAADGLTADLTILAAGTFTINAVALEPTGTVVGSLSETATDDAVPASIQIMVAAK